MQIIRDLYYIVTVQYFCTCKLQKYLFYCKKKKKKVYHQFSACFPHSCSVHKFHQHNLNAAKVKSHLTFLWQGNLFVSYLGYKMSCGLLPEKKKIGVQFRTIAFILTIQNWTKPYAIFSRRLCLVSLVYIRVWKNTLTPTKRTKLWHQTDLVTKSSSVKVFLSSLLKCAF